MKQIIRLSRFVKVIGSQDIKILLLAGVVLMGTIDSVKAQDNKKSPAQANVAESNASIVFIEGKWDAALKEAAKDGKYIFVDAYATWCGPCKLLKAKTFTNKETAAFFNSHFVNLSLDVEKGQGPELAAKWKIQGLPTLLIFDASGRQVAQSVGYISPEDLVAFGKQALEKKQ